MDVFGLHGDLHMLASVNISGGTPTVSNQAASAQTAPAYVAIPQQRTGPGVVVLHAWWGLNDFFKQLCDRLAGAGFIAVAPDLYGGKTAATIEEAQQLLAALDGQEASAKVTDAVTYLRTHPDVHGDGIGAIGFSMGGAWALLLSTLRPTDIAAVVVFYGSEPADFATARAAYLGHYAEDDEWEPTEGVQQLEQALRNAGRNVTFHSYPGTGHWFFEENRPDAYNEEAAQLAWERTIAFLHEHLTPKA
jgi:carboxymethylenebutenolidase